MKYNLTRDYRDTPITNNTPKPLDISGANLNPLHQFHELMDFLHKSKQGASIGELKKKMIKEGYFHSITIVEINAKEVELTGEAILRSAHTNKHQHVKACFSMH